MFRRRGRNLGELPILDVYLSRERARRGDRDDAIPLMRAAVDHLFREGQLLGWGVPATGVLVETLLDRGADGDVATAATLWATAAVGALCGAWMWREAVVGALIILASNGLLYPLAKWIDRRPHKPGREKQTDF